MAGIKSLSIRGIRSFGPEDHDEQKINFEKPLTLILGQNGCGKTTIIESLRYAITGQVPPGIPKESFVHDAKVNRTVEVPAQIKLKMTNAKDKLIDVVRPMKVTLGANKKPQFKTLNLLLSVTDEFGNTSDLSSRCADIDMILQEHLGVSKAIINSVILCHQEDSNWPLDDDTSVKKRFDEIFDAEKYKKCFDALKVIRNEYTLNMKMLNKDIEHLKEKKEELDKKKLDVFNTESSIEESENKIKSLDEELKPIIEKIREIEGIQKNLLEFEKKKDKIKTKLEHNKKEEVELKSNIKTMFEGSKEELMDKINNYEKDINMKEKELSSCQSQIYTFKKDEENISYQMTSNETKYSKLMVLESQHQERIDKSYKMINDTATLAELQLPQISSPAQSSKGAEVITSRVRALHAEFRDQRVAADRGERALQTAVDDCRDKLSRHKQKIVSKENEIDKLKTEVSKVNRDIDDTNESKAKLEAVQKKFEEAEKAHQEAVAELNTEEHQKQMADDEKQLEQNDADIDAIDEKISKLQNQAAKLKEKDLIEEQLKSTEKKVEVLKNKHRSNIVELLGSMPEDKFAASVNKVEHDVRTEVDTLKKDLNKKQLEVTRLETERNHVRDSLKDKRAELTKEEDKLYKACGTQPYADTLAKVNANVVKLQEEKNLLQSSLFIIAKYKEQLMENNCCPLCSRGFEAQNEVSELVSDLTTKVMNTPAQLQKVTEELKEAATKKDQLLCLSASHDKVIGLRDGELPQLEARLKDVDKNISEISESVEELKLSLAEPERKLDIAKQIQGDMPLLDKYASEIVLHTKNLESLKEQCVDMITDMTLDDAKAKQKELKSSKAALKTKIKGMQTKLNQYNKKVQKLIDAKNKLNEEMLQIQKRVQELVSLQEKLKELEENKVKALLELKELQDGTEPLDADLKAKQNSKAEAVVTNRKTIESKRQYINKIESSFEKVKSILKEIKLHEEKNVKKEMEKLKELNNSLKERKAQLETDKEEVNKKIDGIKEELHKQETFKRDLKDNAKMRQAQEEIVKCEQELSEIETKISGVNTDMLSEKEALIGQHTRLFTQKEQTIGKMKELKDRLKVLKQDLAKAQNKNVEKQYNEKYYDLEITKALEKDLKDYSVTLEKCVLEFHREKMENINLIIREMWRKIYKGNDIDYIEIKTETDISTASDRRKYCYRVMQCKSGIQIGMRGRCSAGQKVLACLIIRLALAETFSSRFGILALDEPTTNLDEENVRSLCSALGEIVQERMRQKNFMFIIITHDKEFIDSLGTVDKVTHYYEVSRNVDGKSRIKKIRFT